IYLVENWFYIKNFSFSLLFFFLVFLDAFENYWEFQKMTSSMHQLDSLSNQKSY
ncbi:Uncharacterized protein FWK35_00007981, partial [Aphis craccivora]